MKVICLLSIIYITTCSFTSSGQTKANKVDTTTKTDQSYRWREDYDVSLIKLLANPEKYNGKHVRVIGYLNLEFEGNALYLHKEDYEAAIAKNGLWVNLSRDRRFSEAKYSKKYVIIEAVFDAGDNGHRGLFGGALKDITRLDLWYQSNKKQ